MLSIFIKIFTILSAYQLINVKGESLLETENEINSTLLTSWCDEHLLQDIERHLKVVNLAQENQRLSIDLLSKKLDDLQNLIQIENKNNQNEINSLKFTNCDEALNDLSNNDGVYQLYLPNKYYPSKEVRHDPFFVYCIRDKDANKSWTIIQRRLDGKINFYQNWQAYEIGFGDIFGEHWLGLDKIHQLTNSQPHKLWIELKDFENNTHSAYYDLFAIGNSQTKYTLNVLGNFSGNAGDSLRYHVGQKFSTKDDRNDSSDDNKCAIERKGGWWFNNCQECNLNGEYLNGALKKNLYGMGINWYAWHGSYYSLKYVHMAIRPVD